MQTWPGLVRICGVLLAALPILGGACDGDEDPRLSDADIDDFCSSACARLADCNMVSEQACHDDCVEGSEVDRDTCTAQSHADAVEQAAACVEQACTDVPACINAASCGA